MNRRNFLHIFMALATLPVVVLAAPARPRATVIIHGLDPNNLFHGGSFGRLADAMMGDGVGDKTNTAAEVVHKHDQTMHIKIDPEPPSAEFIKLLEQTLIEATNRP